MTSPFLLADSGPGLEVREDVAGAAGWFSSRDACMRLPTPDVPQPPSARARMPNRRPADRTLHLTRTMYLLVSRSCARYRAHFDECSPKRSWMLPAG
jgi:hypothetical protein